MPKKLQKSLHDYLSKIKLPAPHSPTLPSSKSRIFSGCKHPKTLSFAVYHKDDNSPGHDHHHSDDAATLSDVDRFLFENFKSLYSQNDDGDDDNEYDHKYNAYLKNSRSFERKLKGKMSGTLFDIPLELNGSNRAFIKTGKSSSFMEEAKLSDSTYEDIGCSSSSATATNTCTATVNDSRSGNSSNDPHEKELESLPDKCIATLTYTSDPYNKFRSSMDEVVEARLHHNAKVDKDFMEELLFCYLNMNDKKSYKDIISVFVDTLVSLGLHSDKTPCNSRLVQVAKDRKKFDTVL